MTMPYFNTFRPPDGIVRRAIVERVEVCRPFAMLLHDGLGAFYREQEYVDPFDPTGVLRSDDYIPEDFASALCRDAVKCWGCTKTDDAVRELRRRLLYAVDHDVVNTFAHDLADALGIAH